MVLVWLVCSTKFCDPTNSGPRLSQSEVRVITTWTLTCSQTVFLRVSFDVPAESEAHAVSASNIGSHFQGSMRRLPRLPLQPRRCDDCALGVQASTSLGRPSPTRT